MLEVFNHLFSVTPFFCGVDLSSIVHTTNNSFKNDTWFYIRSCVEILLPKTHQKVLLKTSILLISLVEVCHRCTNLLSIIISLFLCQFLFYYFCPKLSFFVKNLVVFLHASKPCEINIFIF